jgi:CheY-like chemotaxis protein
MLDRPPLLVLIVEDDLFQRLDLVHELQYAGCSVVEAGSGEEAVGYLRNGHQIDLIITDVNLGGPLSGWDVAESFRSVHPEIPVVYVSGNLAEPERQVPDSVFLRKPWQPVDLLKALPMV